MAKIEGKELAKKLNIKAMIREMPRDLRKEIEVAAEANKMNLDGFIEERLAAQLIEDDFFISPTVLQNEGTEISGRVGGGGGGGRGEIRGEVSVRTRIGGRRR